MNGSEYVTSGEIRRKYQISYTTLKRWDEQGKVRTRRTPGGNRRYNAQDIGKLFGETSGLTTRGNYIYARVSSDHQKTDLERQVWDLKKGCDDKETIVIKDIGSGIDWNRTGFKRLLDLVDDGKVKTVTVTHTSRLCRFAYELLERIFEKAGVTIVVLCQSDDYSPNPQQELSEDLISINNYFIDKQKSRHNKKGKGQPKVAEDDSDNRRKRKSESRKERQEKKKKTSPETEKEAQNEQH